MGHKQATVEGSEQVNWFHNDPPLHGECIAELRLGDGKMRVMADTPRGPKTSQLRVAGAALGASCACSKSNFEAEREKKPMAQCPAEYSSHCDHHTKPASNWLPPKHELDKFRYVSGDYVFVLESLLKGTVMLTLQYSFGVRSECHTVAATEQDYDWRVSCRFKYAKAVSDAIPHAEAFLRSLTARVQLPEDCEWIELDDLCVRDSRSGTVFPVPKDARRADILDSLVKQYRRTHRP